MKIDREGSNSPDLSMEDSEKRYSALTQLATSIIWSTAPDGGFVMPQPSWEKYTGQSWEEHQGYGWANAIHKDDREKIKQLWADALAQRREYHSTGRIWNARLQEYRYFEAGGIPLLNESGEVTEWVGIVTDVHEKEIGRQNVERLTAGLETKVRERTAQLEQRNIDLENSRSFLQQLIDSSVEYISVLHNDLTYATVNKRFEETMKLTRQQVAGKHLFLINPKAQGTIQHQAILRALKGETVHINKTASVAKPDIAVDTHFVPWYNQNKIAGVIIMSRDVTDIVKAEADLNKVNLQLQLAQQMAHIGSWEWDVPANKITWSDELYRIYGVEKETAKLSYDLFLNCIHTDDRQMVNETVQRAFRDGKPFSFYHHIIRSNGEVRILHGHGIVTQDGSGKTLRMTGTAQDVTERKTAEEQLKRTSAELQYKNQELVRSNKELESFNYVASHDLQEPLRKIKTFIELLSVSDQDAATREDFIRRINSAADRMSQLIHSLLRYSQLNSEEEFIETDLNQVLQQVVIDLELPIAEKGAVVNTGTLPTIKAIPLQMHQLFANLIGNSLKFSRRKPVIEVNSEIVTAEKLNLNGSVDPGHQYAVIKFKDTGIGFEPEYAETIFKPFQRLHAKKVYGGTGIGLSICDKIVTRHKGFIKAESVLDEGSTFTVVLPVDIS